MSGKVLAFDTSNYTTSVAAVDLSGNILADERKLLAVKKGDRGLRQSHALFQHMENIPDLVKKVMKEIRKEELCAVAVSDRPRPVEGSYMPVFLAGVNFARTLASALDLPVYYFSHQEGHIAAVCGALEENIRTVSFHMSGGTGEILSVCGCRPEKIIGGTRDLSFGQIIDRVGVALGCSFPAGAALDEIACRGVPRGGFSYSSRGNTKLDDPITNPIHIEGACANLSGMETQMLRAIEKVNLSCAGSFSSGAKVDSPFRTASGLQALQANVSADDLKSGSFSEDKEKIVTELFCRVSDALVKMSQCAMEEVHADTIVFVGGVSASAFLRSELIKRLNDKGYRAIFGESRLSSDNACGIGRLGAARYRETRGEENIG